MKTKKLNFLDALFGLLIQPKVVSEELFAEEYPPYGFTIFLCFLLTVFVPIVTQVQSLRLLAIESNAILATSFIFTFTFLFFAFFQALLLLILGIEVDIGKVITLLAFCLAPLMIVIWVIYGINFYREGSLSLVTTLITGNLVVEPFIRKIIPYGLVVANISGFMIYFNCLKMMGGFYSLTAFSVAVLSIIPLYISILGSIVLAEYGLPGTIGSLLQIFPWAEPLLGAFRK